MTLRAKVLVTLGLALVVTLLVFGVLVAVFWWHSLRDLEAHEVHRALARVREAVKEDTERLVSTTIDWGEWDDSYRFMADGNQAFLESNLQDDCFLNLRLDLILFVRPSGEIAYEKAVDRERKAPVPVPASVHQLLAPGGPVLGPEKGTAGILALPEGPLLLVARPILTSKKTGPPRGRLAFARFLGAEEWKRLGERAGMEISCLPPGSPLPGPVTLDQPEAVDPLDSDRIAGYALFTGLDGRPAFIARAVLPRNLVSEGRTGLLFLICGLLGAGLLLGLSTVHFLRSQVLSRLDLLSSDMRRIGGLEDLRFRVSATGTDELAQTAAAVNTMLDSLERSERERARSVEALRASEERVRSILETASSAIIVLSGDLRVVQWNRGAEAILTVGTAEAAGRPFLEDFVDPVAREAAGAALRTVLSGSNASNLEFDIRRPDGSRRSLLWNATPLALPGGAEPEILAVGRDITERKETAAVLREREDRLREVQKLEAVGRLAGGVAHEFNNLMTVVIGHADLMLMRLAAGDPNRPRLDSVRQAGLRAADLTRQLLAFSRKQMVQPRVLDLDSFLDGQRPMLRSLVGELVEFSVRVRPGTPLIRVDPSQLTQVLVNLTLNARDAMPSGGSFTLETSGVTTEVPIEEAPPGAYALLTVSDTGAGMDETVRRHVFEPFFTTKGLASATGLGLATVYGIVRQSGGAITFDSEPGRGTAFRIWIPAAPPGEEEARDPGRMVPSSRGAETVLVVEDEPSVLALVRSTLEDAGFRVLEAKDPEVALATMREHAGPIDLMVTDVIMPKMTGVELYRAVIETRPGIPTLFMSGYSDDPRIAEAAAQGGAFLEKPFLPVQLIAAVRGLLDRGPR